MRKRFIKNSVIAVLLATTLMTPLVSGVMSTSKVYATGTTTTPTTSADEEESSTDANNTTTNNNTSSSGTTAQYNDPNFSFYRTSIFGRQFLNAWAYVARQGRQDGGTTGVGTGSGGADGNGAEVSSDPSADVVSAVKNLKDKFKFDEDSTMYVNTTNAGATSSSTGMGLNGGFTGAFFSGNANPDSIKREGDIFGGELTDAMKMVDGSIGGAGSSNTEWTFTYKDMNLPLKNNGRGSSFVIDGSPYGYYGAALNTMGYDNVSANFSKNPTGFAALAKIGGFVFFWELKLMRIANSMFSITAKVLQSLNPFSVFNDMDKGSPILSDEKMSTNLYAQFTDKFTGFLGGVRLFSLTIMAFIIVFGLARAYMSERGSLGQFFKSMGIRLAFTGFAFSAVMMSTTYLLDLTSNMYSKVGGMNDTMTDDVFSTYVDFEAWMKSSRLALPHGTRIIWNTHSNSVDAISIGGGVSNMSTRLELNRVNKKLSRLKALNKNSGRGTVGRYDSSILFYENLRSRLQSQLTASDNVGSNNAAQLSARYSDLAMLINQNSYFNTVENRALYGTGANDPYNILYAMRDGQRLATLGNDDDNPLTEREESQIDLNDSLIDSIFTRYLNNTKFDPGAYESYIKSGKDFQKYINGDGVKVVNWQVEQKELQQDPSLFGKMKAGENLRDSDAFKKIPMISMLYSVDSDAGIYVSTVDTKKGLVGIESKTGDVGIYNAGYGDLLNLDSTDSTDTQLLQKNYKDGTALYHSGMPMSVITAYNYLSSSFGPTSLTYTNPSNLNTTYAKGSHASVTMPGDMSNALSLVKSLVKYGAMLLVIFIFSASLMLSTFKAGLAIFTQAPLALSGFITFIVKFLVACIMMIVSIVITIFFYFISFNIIEILSGT